MISENFRSAFNELEKNDKKLKISEEIIFIGELVKKINSLYNLNLDFQLKKYDLDFELNEDETLTFLYENIFEIQKQLLLLIANIQK